jgi:transposase
MDSEIFHGPTISIADIRQRFDVSRTTAWLMVQRANLKPVNTGMKTVGQRYAAADLPKLREVPLRRRISR